MMQQFQQFKASLPVRGAWIEIPSEQLAFALLWSLPVRGAWIEIILDVRVTSCGVVAPRAGSVD